MLSRLTPRPDCARRWSLISSLAALLVLTLLTACSDPPSPEAQATARQALEAMMAGDSDGVAQYLAPEDRLPTGVEGNNGFLQLGSIALQRCRGFHVDYSDRGISPPTGARLVTATFSQACVPDRPGTQKTSLGIVVVPIDGRWYVARFQ